MATVRLRNTNPMGEVYLHLIGKNLTAGEEFDIDAALGKALLEQVGNYELVKPPKKAAAKKATEPTPDETEAGDQS